MKRKKKYLAFYVDGDSYEPVLSDESPRVIEISDLKKYVEDRIEEAKKHLPEGEHRYLDYEENEDGDIRLMLNEDALSVVFMNMSKAKFKEVVPKGQDISSLDQETLQELFDTYQVFCTPLGD